jgi:endonuclease YncB( thermonuclease family)
LKGGINKKILVLIVVGICVCAGIVLYLKVGAPSAIRNLRALYITSSNATLEAEYDVENQWSDVKIRFGYKKANSSNGWNYTDWREISENVENATLYEDIDNLTPGTRYEFKAILQHDSEVIYSPIYFFETYSIPLNYEAYGTVDYTIDGDTIQVNLTWVNPLTSGVHTGSGQKVRFSGGIDAPEIGNEGGEEAKNFVRDLCWRGTEVFLDLDNLSDTPYHDVHGRLLGVVYVKKNGKWVNVNAELLRWGLKAYPYHDWLKYRYFRSEFDSDQWLENDYPYVL